MPEWATQRRFPRYTVHRSLLYEITGLVDHLTGVGWTLELSEGGACVELPEHLAPQTPLRLRLQPESPMVEVEGRVVWAGKPDLPGGICHGVAFAQLAPAQRHALCKLLYFPGAERRTGFRPPTDLAATCSVSGQAGVPLQGRIRDIGIEGLLLLLPEALAPGTALAVTLRTPTEPVTVDGDIVWVEPRGVRSSAGLIAHGFHVTSLSRSKLQPLAPPLKAKL